MTYTFAKNAFHLTGIVASKKQYDEAIKALAKNITMEYKTKPSATFTKELFAVETHRPLTEQTVWGGVALKKVDVAKDFIQKLLVIKKHGVLGFEIHKKKKEHLRIIEGVCIVLSINHKDNKKEHEIAVSLASKGDTFTFEPNDEHGILTLTNCIIEETSTNHLDDLVYIFPASQMV